MRISVKLMGTLREKMPASGFLELEEGATVEDALTELEILSEHVQVTTVNGSFERDRKRVLAEGDELSAIPPVGGG